MEKLILNAVNHIKQISKKKVSLDSILQRLNKTSATNIDTDAIRMEIEQMLHKGVINQDYKNLISSTVPEATSDEVSPENMNTDCTEQNSVQMSPYPISHETPRKNIIKEFYLR